MIKYIIYMNENIILKLIIMCNQYMLGKTAKKDVRFQHQHHHIEQTFSERELSTMLGATKAHKKSHTCLPSNTLFISIKTREW